MGVSASFRNTKPLSSLNPELVTALFTTLQLKIWREISQGLVPGQNPFLWQTSEV